MVTKSEQVLALDPPYELRFKGPFTDVVTSELRLSNGSASRVCFKVKTTAPKRYCVRPNSGLIEPGKTIAVAVMLQPFEYDPNERNKHKFMVQTMYAPDGPIDSHEALWKSATPDQLMDSKLKCVFVPAEVQQNEVGDVASPIAPELAPTLAAPSPKESIREDLDEGGNEIRKLNDELRKVTDENSQLKNEGMRLRKLAMASTTASSPATSSAPQSLQAPPPNQLPPLAYLIAALILGIILGKFVL
jgi:vesicle-associated membrane protein-associated protein A